ncbi:MAG TPA: POTRA domain-containing protein, partial [Chthoniobacterales bacterium]|nr:POTRA domain-containing protein [Chthoniobacterales bacterium]
ALTGLTTGSEVSRKDLQDAADALVRCGLFAKVNYNFATRGDGVLVTYHIEENPRVPVSYDDFPWFVDSELNDAIRKDLPFFDGSLPEAGAVVELASKSLQSLLASKGVEGRVEHLVIASPLADTSVQQFRVEGLPLQIASVEFSDTALKQSPAVQQHLTEIIGKPYSRMAIDLFLAEQIRPVYLETGNLKAKLGPAEVRLSGDPNQKMPRRIPVYIPCQPGPVFHWNSVQWSGNAVLSSITLTNAMGLKPGDVADGMKIEGAWDRVREEYGHQGYLDVKLKPAPSYDDNAHTVSYLVAITEGPQFRYNAMTITGISLAGERMIRDAWPQQPGEVFDKTRFEELLTHLESNRKTVFKDLPIHYDTVGHWLQTDPNKKTVDVLLDFK